MSECPKKTKRETTSTANKKTSGDADPDGSNAEESDTQPEFSDPDPEFLKAEQDPDVASCKGLAALALSLSNFSVSKPKP
ncbi:hypothetical protein PC129_g12812 [Phytophthora cactorum]|uniref:Uncharacterized protein n=1 Tax=Phytophthora cactorum TaxID=29920 RepID=A0A8T1G0F3_9STRA|nr:hypothetical protein PC111_g13440 [Phytophthora cactorum]KAG2894901.1 hypothetical protein PC114_g15697 [Phytophthora cactorum]KAG2980214.1 hypothetical protein PC118_g11297 [Phytophthora cactorum]KAG3004770.1 hypothetical protein PC119_g15530 [Phytophthora cactorum]KAG3055300.1 hypothetical protein PC121_g15855 [Phytophthora cactorum]